MKRLIALTLCLALLLSGCSAPATKSTTTEETLSDTSEAAEGSTLQTSSAASVELSYTGLSDPLLLGQIEDMVYTEAVESLGSEDYVVENVTAVFISQEYIDELMFNSQSNVYFGYTLDELNSMFQDTRYVFTLGEDGQTTVQPMEIIEDNTTETIIKNVAIGSGVILVCVTVSVLTAGTAPAVCAIFAASAQTASVMALSGGALGAVSAGVVRGIQTGDMNEALKAAALGGSEGFKWGAITGAITGGGKEAFALKAATKGGLTMNQVAVIQKESKLPLDVIAQFKTMEEYEVYKQASLKAFMVNGKTALVQSVNLDYVSELADGTKVTNLERMQRGLAPLDPATGKAYELHHIGQSNNGTLAMLTQEQHRGAGTFAKLHNIWNDSGVSHGSEWTKTTKEFWKYLGELYASGGTI